MGLTTNEDFCSCLRRFDVDKLYPGSDQTITQYFQPKWFGAGGRLEKRADIFYAAFKGVSEQEPFEVPMANFMRSVKRVLNYDEQECNIETMRAIAEGAGF
jgi:hypothetical protein